MRLGMRRYDRPRFFAFGVWPAVNALGLLLYGLGLATQGSGGAGRALPALIVIVVICLALALAATVKRGRDLGLPVWLTVLTFGLALAMGPLLLALVAYLACAKSGPKADQFGAAPPPAHATTWIWALLNLVWPWAIILALARIL